VGLDYNRLPAGTPDSAF